MMPPLAHSGHCAAGSLALNSQPSLGEAQTPGRRRAACAASATAYIGVCETTRLQAPRVSDAAIRPTSLSDPTPRGMRAFSTVKPRPDNSCTPLTTAAGLLRTPRRLDGDDGFQPVAAHQMVGVVAVDGRVAVGDAQLHALAEAQRLSGRPHEPAVLV